MRYITVFAVLLLAAGVVSRAIALPALPVGMHAVPVHKATFKNGASSSGWIDFQLAGGRSILIPAKVNGEQVWVRLIDGAATSYLDKNFAASIGFHPLSGHAAHGDVDVQVQLGDLTLRRVAVSVTDLHARRSDRLYAPFILGDEVFNQTVVDIDFARHRIAFQDPHAALKPPPGAVSLPLVRRLDAWTVPVSVEGAAPVPFEWFLGDPAPVTVYQPYYQARRLLQHRPSSIRLGGGLNGQRPQEQIATLSHVGFAGVDFSQVPGVFPSNAVRGSDSPLIAGNIGLALLARFHLIVDYPHRRLYAAPYKAMEGVPFAKDRLGLYVRHQDNRLVVEFVAPGSPAQSAGFKTGERIIAIDQKPAEAWTPAELTQLRFTPGGNRVDFTMEHGGIRQVKAKDYF